MTLLEDFLSIFPLGVGECIELDNCWGGDDVDEEIEKEVRKKEKRRNGNRKGSYELNEENGDV